MSEANNSMRSDDLPRLRRREGRYIVKERSDYETT